MESSPDCPSSLHIRPSLAVCHHCRLIEPWKHTQWSHRTTDENRTLLPTEHRLHNLNSCPVTSRIIRPHIDHWHLAVSPSQFPHFEINSSPHPIRKVVVRLKSSRWGRIHSLTHSVVVVKAPWNAFSYKRTSTLHSCRVPSLHEGGTCELHSNPDSLK